MNDRDIVRMISAIIGSSNTEDDCAVFPHGGEYLTATTDMLHEKTDFPKGMTDWQIGWMSAAVTLSDIASTGSRPLFLLLAAGLDSGSTGRIEEITRGANDCCRKFGAKLAGGDIDSHSELTIVTTGIGAVSTDRYVSRKAKEKRPLRAGDIVCVCGDLGIAERGLKDYYAALVASDEPSNLKTDAFKALCEPQPKVFEGQILGNLGVLSMMDISDGLSLSLYDLSEQNDCGFSIDKGLIPTDIYGGIDFETAFYGAGDFGLLYVCSPETYESIVTGRYLQTLSDKFSRNIGLDTGDVRSNPLSLGYKIGVVTDEKGVFVDGSIVENRGYLHKWN